MSRLKDKNNWKGCWTALVTPLSINGSELSIDVTSLEKIIEAQISSGTLTGLVIAGSTGEGSLLSASLYKELLIQSKRIVNDRLPLVAGIGIGGTRSCVENVRIAKEAGFDAVLASPPAYIKAPQRGLIAHYLTLAKEGLPICLYEIAGRAASSIEIETLVALKNSSAPEAKNLVAIKDASGDMSRIIECSQKVGDTFALLSGDDFTLHTFIKNGGDGVISVSTHVVPKSMKKIISDTNTGKNESAQNIQSKMLPLLTELFADSNPIPVKTLCKELGLISSSNFCPPLLSSLDENTKILISVFSDFNSAIESNL